MMSCHSEGASAPEESPHRTGDPSAPPQGDIINKENL